MVISNLLFGSFSLTSLAVAKIIHGSIRELLELRALEDQERQWKAQRAGSSNGRSIPSVNVPILGGSDTVTLSDLVASKPTFLFITPRTISDGLRPKHLKAIMGFLRAKSLDKLFVICSGPPGECLQFKELLASDLPPLPPVPFLADPDLELAFHFEVEETPIAFSFDESGKCISTGSAELSTPEWFEKQ